jgi:hypothetical protein
MLRIRDNEWRTPTSSWDVETIGQRTTIRNRSRDIALVLRMEPRERLVVERLRMFFKGSLVTCDEKNGLFVEHLGNIEQVMHLHNMALKGPRIGIYCPLTDEGVRAARAGQAPKVIY